MTSEKTTDKDDFMSESATRIFVVVMIATVLILTSPLAAMAQGLELNLGYSHASGNFGVDGFNAGAAWWFTPRVTVGLDYDSAWDTSRIDAFGFTPIGLISSHTHLQSLMVGPRIFFSDQKLNDRTLKPFGEVQVGYSRLNSDLTQVTFPDLEIADDAFAWLLGAGADYRFDPHWAARVKLGLLRTHHNDAGQSRLKLVLGVTYTFGAHVVPPNNQVTRP